MLVLPAISLCHRELIRFVRQPNRLIGALATPLVFWLLIGAGMGRSFQSDGPSQGGGYIEYFFPGTILMVVLFTAIFSTISIIEDRREGFLQSVLVAPVSRFAIVLGKTLGGTALAATQGVLFLLLAPFIGIHVTFASFLVAVAMITIISFSLTALGICIAWRMSSTQGFHAIMNLFLMPMWFLSGALFPADRVMFKPIKWIMMLNPLSYGYAGIRRALYWNISAGAVSLPTLSSSLSISAAFAVGMFLLASWIAGSRVSADLQ